MGAVLAGLLIAVLMSAGAEKAHAGGYYVVECQENNANAPDLVYGTNTSSPYYYGSTNCDGGAGSIKLLNGANIGPVYAWSAWSFFAPAGTYFNDIDFEYNLRSQQDPPHDHVAYIVMPGAAQWNYNSPGWQTAVTAQTVVTSITGYLYCPGTGGGCSADGTAIMAFRQMKFKITDTSPPGFNFTGSLVDNDPARGTESLTLAASDAGGGLSGATLKVNGTTIGTPPGSCVPTYSFGTTQFRPCASPYNFAFNLNTEDPPFQEGTNRIEACVRDYNNLDGGAPYQTCHETTVNVDNSCTRSAATTAGTNLSARLEPEKGQGGQTVQVKSNEDLAVAGTLTGPGGPVGGAQICVYEKVQIDGARRSVVKTGFTRPDGSFHIGVDEGPSRVFDIAYRANNQQVEHEKLVATSSVVPTLRVSDRSLRNGGAARFKGKIPGPFSDGRAITLQARAGKKWRTFKQVKSKVDGQFAARYPFRHTTGNIVYRFRASVKGQAGYPYEPGSSKKKKVRVRG